MADLSHLSDDDLLALYNQEKAKQQTGFVAGPTAAPDHIAARSDYSQAVKSIQKDRSDWQAQQPTLASLDRFEELNKQANTGGIQNMIPGLKGATVALSPRLQEMQSISGALQTHSVPQGQGATSDFERSLFARGVPTLDKQGPVNQSVANQMRARNKQQADWLDFEDAYLKQNGHLNGAPEAWQGYVAANPYATTGKTQGGDEITIVNPNRADWRSYFGQSPAPRPQAKAPPMKPKTSGDGWKVVKVH